jgi:hypothetical protein
MRYTVRKSVILVLGRIWMPDTEAGTIYELNAYDVGNIERPITKETVEAWLCTHSGDFQSVIDFSASIESEEGTTEIPWNTEENELTFNDCLYGEEVY